MFPFKANVIVSWFVSIPYQVWPHSQAKLSIACSTEKWWKAGWGLGTYLADAYCAHTERAPMLYPCNLFILATPLTLTHTHIHMVGRLCPYVRMFSPSYTALWEAESDVKMKGEWERLNCDCIYDIVYMCVYGVYCAQRWKHSSICGSPRYFIPLCTYFSCGVLTKYNPAKTDKYLKLQSWILSIIVTMFTRESGAR